MAASTEIHTLFEVVIEAAQGNREPFWVGSAAPQHAMRCHTQIRRRLKSHRITRTGGQAAVCALAEDVGTPRPLVNWVTRQIGGRRYAAER